MLLARHRVRFLELADIFLASGMVPAYTAAAFIKKFARLALTAPPAGEEGAICAVGWLREGDIHWHVSLSCVKCRSCGPKPAHQGLTIDQPNNRESCGQHTFSPA